MISFGPSVTGGAGDPGAQRSREAAFTEKMTGKRGSGFHQPKPDASGSSVSFSLSLTPRFSVTSVQHGLLFCPYRHYLNMGLVVSHLG